MYQNKKEFMQLKSEWDEKLRDSGFKDIEDSSGRLKSYDRRTQSFGDRQSILEFFLALDHFLESKKDIPTNDRRILELYSCGVKITHISDKTRMGKTTIKETIKRYSFLISHLITSK